MRECCGLQDLVLPKLGVSSLAPKFAISSLGRMAFDIELWGLASERFLARAGESMATSDLILGEVASTPVLEDHSESECSTLLGIRSPCIVIRDSWWVLS